MTGFEGNHVALHDKVFEYRKIFPREAKIKWKKKLYVFIAVLFIRPLRRSAPCAVAP